MDSFFATVEQQARPHLRGRAVGIAPAESPGSTILAASIEAKQFGIGTGTLVGDARALIPGLVILPPDPTKYRVVHRRFRRIMAEYAAVVKPRSVDEVALWLNSNERRPSRDIAAAIKQRIRAEVGEWLSSSVGIGPNWLLAKTASAIDKPDGLFEIRHDNIRPVLSRLKLTDLCGIAHRLEARFNLAGISSPLDLYDLPPWELKRRLGIIGYYWHLRLHGYAIDMQDWSTRSLGHSSVIPRPTASPAQLKPLLHKLCFRVGRRLRKEGWLTGQVIISGSVASDGRHSRNRWGYGRWHQSAAMIPHHDGLRLFQQSWRLLSAAPPPGPLRKLAVTTRHLTPTSPEQLPLFVQQQRRQRGLASTDRVNDRWGEYTIHPAGMLGTTQVANDAIAFGQDLKLEREHLQS